jgi:hypothetical protein
MWQLRNNLPEELMEECCVCGNCAIIYPKNYYY